MSFFNDTTGKQWRIRLTGPVLTKIREATGIKLADPAGRGALEACQDGEIQTRVLWLLCADQDPTTTPDKFADAMASGEVFEAAKHAIYEAITDFTQPSLRPALAKALETEAAVTVAAQQLAMARMDGEPLKAELIDALRTGMDANIATILTQLRSGSVSPVSLASPAT